MQKEFYSKVLNMAKTKEEYEAIYRFRYKVYYEELGRDGHFADHEKCFLKYPRDESENTALFYVGAIDNIIGVTCIECWRKKL
jgi:hypothetical protein